MFDFSSKCLNYDDHEEPSSVHLVLSWLWDINSWERHIYSWDRDSMLWECNRFFSRGQHIFLVATSLMRKQTYVTIATRDFQRW